MQKQNYIYREIINDKFSELITTNSSKTWNGMRELLEIEMPEDRRKKWLTWFINRTSILFIVLFSFILSLQVQYY